MLSILTKQYWTEIFDPAMILKTTLQTIIGSVLVGSFFMVFSDFIFKPMNMNGRWELRLHPEQALSRLNACIDLRYDVLFVQHNHSLTGNGEKSRESKSKHPDCHAKNIATKTYAPGQGKRMNIEGFIEVNYIAPDNLMLSYSEGSINNKRFTMASLQMQGENRWVGRYDSQISRASGVIELVRVGH